MSPEDPQSTADSGDKANNGRTEQVKPGPSIFHRILALLRPLAIGRFKIIDLADPEQTISGIKKDIEFRGFNLWILVFSIIICSIGLNVDSAAVVIGAMLISPLMGPIMGIGLGLGTNDAATFKSALGNLAIAAGIAILTSALYFAFSPINEASSELLSRTQPTLLDVVVALFGGLAGILAGSRKEKSNVIPGVAIATALMPPLCTAGYGVANGEWNFLAGGFYLFLINTALIALATWMVVRYLRFPLLHYVEPALERRYKRLSAILFLALLGPSGYIFYNIVVVSREDAALHLFVDEHMDLGNNTVSMRINRESVPPELEVSIYGGSVTPEQEQQWRSKLSEISPEFTLNLIHNGVNESDLEDIREQLGFMMNSYADLSSKDQRIESLNAQLIMTEGQLRKMESKLLPDGLGMEIMHLYPEATAVRWGRIQGQLRTLTELPTATSRIEISWSQPMDPEQQSALANTLSEWLETRLEAPGPIEVTFIFDTPEP